MGNKWVQLIIVIAVIFGLLIVTRAHFGFNVGMGSQTFSVGLGQQGG